MVEAVIPIVKAPWGTIEPDNLIPGTVACHLCPKLAGRTVCPDARCFGRKAAAWYGIPWPSSNRRLAVGVMAFAAGAIAIFAILVAGTVGVHLHLGIG